MSSLHSYRQEHLIYLFSVSVQQVDERMRLKPVAEDAAQVEMRQWIA